MQVHLGLKQVLQRLHITVRVFSAAAELPLCGTRCANLLNPQLNM